MVEKVACYIKVEEAQAARRKAERPPPSVNKPEKRVPQPPPQSLPRAREARPTFQPGPEVRQAPRVAAVHAPRPGLWNTRFGPTDLEGLELPHDDALIIKAIIANSRVARVFVDTESSVNILFRTTFEEMQIDATELQPVATSLYGFTGNEVKSMGQIKLVISLGTEPLVGEVMGEQKVSRRCYVDMVQVEARKNQRMQDGGVHAVQEEPPTMAEELIPWEEVQLYAERPETLTRIASDLPPSLKEELVQCLIRNQNVFAWSTEELPRVKPEVAEHKLHLLPDSRPVKHKKRNFSADQNKIIRAEVDQLKKAGHVQEVQFPSWLSNVVLVKKPNNK
ncbi:uncharacterized protein LOC122011339 [Zingiber officinale]|uniref:uncharacterized protein LOC122011339 n=1 Tax=Zingiber officinale TaxID=94328 RepID=UPI001C4DC8A1|nr:uncharacterized protein LOC122011339 [Zingiber officinale]